MLNRLKGQWAENAAHVYLEKQGLRCLRRNYQCKMGEIDLIMQDKKEVVFVEVRYRGDKSYGNAEETVDYYKQQKIIKTALYYLQRYKMVEKINCRFDVVALDDSDIVWIKNAFQMDF